MDIELPRDFKEFLQSLTSNSVEYLLIGGYAVGYHSMINLRPSQGNRSRTVDDPAVRQRIIRIVNRKVVD